jgi:hypothetical protein
LAAIDAPSLRSLTITVAFSIPDPPFAVEDLDSIDNPSIHSSKNIPEIPLTNDNNKSMIILSVYYSKEIPFKEHYTASCQRH